jgi:3' exoribonuclease, RNase T-like
MKYFIDFEFIEGFHKPLFGKKRHFIDLISVGIVAEDGREYYAISNEFRRKDADKWVNENVIDKIEGELFQKQTPFEKTHFNFGLKTLLKWFGKSNLTIAREIKEFCNQDMVIDNTSYPVIEFNGYYADYDWVLFCSLFGKMIDLPNAFPMYCKDLKQLLDEKLMTKYSVNNTEITLLYSTLNPKWIVEIRSIETLEEKIEYIKTFVTDYPKQENEHNALADARWNQKLYNFINKL